MTSGESLKSKKGVLFGNSIQPVCAFYDVHLWFLLLCLISSLFPLWGKPFTPAVQLIFCPRWLLIDQWWVWKVAYQALKMVASFCLSAEEQCNQPANPHPFPLAFITESSWCTGKSPLYLLRNNICFWSNACFKSFQKSRGLFSLFNLSLSLAFEMCFSSQHKREIGGKRVIYVISMRLLQNSSVIATIKGISSFAGFKWVVSGTFPEKSMFHWLASGWLMTRSLKLGQIWGNSFPGVIYMFHLLRQRFGQ